MLMNGSEDIHLSLQSRVCSGNVKMLPRGYTGQMCNQPCRSHGSPQGPAERCWSPGSASTIVPMPSTPRMHPMMLLAAAAAPPSSPPPPPQLYGVKATLVNDAIWKEFDALGTEMIITKTGRRMFPHLRFRLTGLQPNRLYIVLMELVLAENARYKYSQEVRPDGCGRDKTGGWRAAGAADIQAAFSARAVFHPQSPALGSAWMEKDISFVHAKMTNNARAPNGNILLSSMHKYFPRIRVIETTDVSAIMHSPTATFEFEHTSFIAVTAYQNQKIIELKIKKNPFAKGFREDGKARLKRKLGQNEDTGNNNTVAASTSPEPSLSSPANRTNMDDDAVSTSSGFASVYGSGSETSSPINQCSPPAFADSPHAEETSTLKANHNENSIIKTESKGSSSFGLLSIDYILSRPDPPPRRYSYKTPPEETNLSSYNMAVPSPSVSPSYWYPENLSGYAMLRDSEVAHPWTDTYSYPNHLAPPMLPVLQPAPLDFSVRRYRY